MQRVKLIVAERERMVEELARTAARRVPEWRQLRAVPARGSMGGHEVWQGLVDRGVLVRDCSRWPRLDDCLRVTVGTPEEDDRFLDALREVLGTVRT